MYTAVQTVSQIDESKNNMHLNIKSIGAINKKKPEQEYIHK